MGAEIKKKRQPAAFVLQKKMVVPRARLELARPFRVQGF